MKTTEVKRKSRKFWAVDDDAFQVAEVIGYSCAPNTPQMWWVPVLGYTMSQAHHLFKTEKAALKKLDDLLLRELDTIATAIKVTRKRLREIEK